MHSLAAATGPAWSPRQLGAKLIWWIDPDVGATIASGRIASITDRSGNGHNAVQSTAGSRPLDSTATLGGRTRRIIRCDGSTVCMPVGSASSSVRLVHGTGRVYLVARVGGSVTDGYYIASSQYGSGSNTGAGVSARLPASRRHSVGNAGSVVREIDTASWTAGTWHCTRLQYESGTVSTWRNGVSVGSGAQLVTPADVAMYPFALGAGGSGAFGAGTAASYVDLAVAIHTTDGLSAADESQLSAWMQRLYGVAA